MTLEFTWWELLLLYSFAIVAFLGVGIVLGLIVAGVAVAIMHRNGVVLGRWQRIGALLLGAVIGAGINYVVAISIW